MMSKKIIRLLFVCLPVCIGKVNAQTEAMYSQYMFNMMTVNPAYAGSREVLSANFLYRKQWVGLDGAPKTTAVSIDGTISDKKVGLGVQLYDDRIGAEKVTGLKLSVSTRIRVSENGILSGGLTAGMMNYQVNLTAVPNRFTPSDPAFGQNLNKWQPSVGMGLYYATDKFYAGFSMPNVIHTRLNELEMISSGIPKVNDQHYFLTSGFVATLSEDVKLKPSVMMKVVSGAPVQIDFNTNLWLKDMIGLGVSYRTGDAYVGMLELQANRQFRIGYAYDVTVSRLKGYNQGSHEIYLRMEFGSDKSSIKSTRYF